MTQLINPATARLGVTRTWTVNYPMTLSSNGPKSQSYKIQSYIFCLQSFAHWIFAAKFHRRFYLDAFIIYHQLKLNVIGFLSSKKNSRHLMDITVSFFDFNAHTFYFDSFQQMASRVSQSLNFEYNVEDLTLSMNCLYTEPNLLKFYGFFYYYCKSYIILKSLFKNYVSLFQRLLKLSQFKVGFIRIHKYFFNDFPVKCLFELKPYLSKITAKFLAIYLERKVRTGTSVPQALSSIHKYLQRLDYVVGYKIICAGRFQRGKKAGFVSRQRGVFSYGRYHKNHFLDYATSTVDLKTGLCGFKVWLCYTPLIHDNTFVDKMGPVAKQTRKF